MPIVSILNKYIEDYRKTFTDEELRNPETPLFYKRFGWTRDSDGKYSSSASKDLLRQIKNVRPKSSEYKVDIHSLRTTFSSIASSAFFPDAMRKKVLGHKQEGMDAKYTYEEPELWEEFYKKLEELNFDFIHGVADE